MTDIEREIGLDAFRSREWMSERIDKSLDWLAHHMDQVPHIKVGRDVHFTERLAQEFIESKTRRPVIGRTDRSRGNRR